MVKVDLTAAPYYLNTDQITWVEETLNNLTDEEKIGQLFFNLFSLEGGKKFYDADLTNEDVLKRYHIGGARYEGGNKEDVQHLLNDLQKHTKVPVLVAANCDSGGNGACKDGTYIASAAQCEAAQDTKVAYNAGLVSARESSALGVHINFDPCVDILKNWRNTIVNTRSYGTDAETVIKYSSAFIDGFNAERNMITCIKHFPGDGTEERDQHLVLGVNELTTQEWDDSFRKVYQHHIDRGVQMIMAGHIAQPAYSKKLNPNLEDKDILPATLSSELITDLLKDDMKFNGLVVTDASHMLGMTASMRREDYVPLAIASGCDMFLFFNDLEEDYQFMLKGYEKGVITEERLNDAVRRVLGLKAQLSLHKKQKDGSIIQPKEALDIIGCTEHLEMRAEAADLGITLVKNTLNQLPIRPETHKNIMLYVIEGEKDGIYKSANNVADDIIKELESRGFNVTLNDGSTRIKGKTLAYRNNVDAALVFANIIGYAAENNYRIKWGTAMSNEIPWYVHEVPTVFVSTNFTTHLHDATMVKAYINAYHSNHETIKQTIDKIMGESEFKGAYNDLVWTDKWQAKL
ncbi:MULTISPECIES: glycoside hydrolase family 3 protein [Staphylococcus]|jgi:beta-N-acetylhexosaminidase|uniref:beta-N-acetylhexosaminidase n=1 Tax=Staphylococcus nepalensis TaxID=214473 RepID=A0A291JHD4_9STAP|nr:MULTISPECIES: glycoside hydrolase family 3 N-terminal domain-containing protein [Staphylococcus]VDG66190.1 beta-hexosamidase A [Lacrimispora indolis]ATH59274.1 glycosyl hydrolase [Staphylococcus nepalensis]ATH64367.1 glycosyl hydrolase [Staphylococcus nepalensis]AWI43726.1 glycosyl hydrolase [Staphylococcus nepalensis]MBO1212608.1 glycoside hydrolase family 3 protein [Staphylococcus nepalensis]